MHAVDRLLLKENKNEDKTANFTRKSTNNVASNPGKQENKFTNLINPVLNKTSNVISEYTNDEKTKLEKVILALTSEKKQVENRVFQQEKKTNDYLKEYEDLKQNFQELELENYRLKEEKENLKIELNRERSLLGNGNNLSQKGSNASNEIYEKRLEEMRKDNEKILAQKHLLENIISNQKKQIEDSNQKLICANDEILMLQKKSSTLAEFLNKKERQIKKLIEEINKSQAEGLAESLIDKSEKLLILEEELRKQDIKISNLESELNETAGLYFITKEKLEKTEQLSKEQKAEISKINEELKNLEKFKEKNLKDCEEITQNHLKSKQILAEIMNFLFEFDNFFLTEHVFMILSRHNN